MVMDLFSNGHRIDFDLLPSLQDLLPPTIKHICRGQVFQGFVIALMVVILDKFLNLVFQLTGEIIVLQQDSILQ